MPANSEAVDLDDLRKTLGYDDVGEQVAAAAEATDFLVDLRSRVRLSRGEIAALLGVTPPRITEIERGGGRRGPSFDLIKRWGRACGVEVQLVANPLVDEQQVWTLTRQPGLAVTRIVLAADEGLYLTAMQGCDVTVVAHTELHVARDKAPEQEGALFTRVPPGTPVAIAPRLAEEDDCNGVLLRPAVDAWLDVVIVEVGPAVTDAPRSLLMSCHSGATP